MTSQSNTELLPKKIWMYWDKGWNNAPELVKKCRESWVYHHPDWEINFLDAQNITQYFDIYEWALVTATANPQIFAAEYDHNTSLYLGSIFL